MKRAYGWIVIASGILIAASIAFGSIWLVWHVHEYVRRPPEPIAIEKPAQALPPEPTPKPAGDPFKSPFDGPPEKPPQRML